jgi:flagella basal body P-ring formation protein FlgA
LQGHKTKSFIFAFFLTSFIYANFYKELKNSIYEYYSYIPVPITFSINIDTVKLENVEIPSKYNQGYNELNIIGKNNLPIKKIPFYLDVYVQVPTAINNINKGEIFNKQHIGKDWKNINHINNSILFDAEELIGKESIFFKKKGSIFLKNDIREPFAITKQDICTITARVGSVIVTMPCIALKNGAIGSTIKVLNTRTNKTIDAVVINSRNVEVKIN